MKLDILKRRGVLLFIAGFYLLIIFVFFNHAAGKQVTIRMAENGFNPTSITINQNDTVIFINSGVQNHWPASNIHPSHAIYPEFDPKRGIAPGKSWSFKFNKPGSWRFHDHLYPQFSGVINVTGNKSGTDSTFKKLTSPITTFTQKFTSSKDANISFDGKDLKTIVNDKSLLSSYLKKNGIAEIMARLVQESGGGSSFDCHQEAHAIGRMGYEIVGEQAFQQCDASCHSGCYHGAMESFLNQNGTANLAQNIDDVCKKFGTSFGLFECLHGVGHGVLAYLDYDLPASINECRGLKDSFAQSSCYGGLFMENILTGQGLGASTQDHNTQWVNKSDPNFPCDKVDSSYPVQYQCWQMQTSWMLTLAGYNFDIVSRQCLKAPDNMIPVCFKSMGRDASGNTLRNPEKIVAICKKHLKNIIMTAY